MHALTCIHTRLSKLFSACEQEVADPGQRAVFSVHRSHLLVDMP